MGVLVRRGAASTAVALVVAAGVLGLPGVAAAAEPAAAAPAGVEIEVLDGVVDGGAGFAIVTGTVRCTEAVAMRVSGRAVQPASGPAFGLFAADVDCAPGAPVAWDAVLPHLGDAPFEPGELDVSVTASIPDAAGGTAVVAEDSGAVTLSFALRG